MILVRRPETPDRPTEAQASAAVRQSGRDVFASAAQAGAAHAGRSASRSRWRNWRFQPKSIVWDIGAGSGSVSIEAALLATEGTAYAIEMDPEDINLIRANAERFRVKNLVPVLGRRPRRGEICRSPIAFSSAAAAAKLRGWWSWRTSN